MRILFAADVQPDPHSGAAGTEVQTAAALSRLGHEVECVWAGDLPHRIRHGNLHYLLELPSGYRDVIRARWRAREYDVTHVNQPHGWLAARDHRGRPGVFVQRSHGWEPRVEEVLAGFRRRWRVPEKRRGAGLATKVLRRLLARHSRLAVQYCDGTIVSASLCGDYLIHRHRANPARVVVIPQAAPDEYLARPAPSPDPERCRRVLYVGQFAFFKGPAVLAEALRQLAAEHPEAEFTWVCGASHHEQARALLEGVAPRVRFLGWRTQDELLALYDRHGVFLFPSLVEGFGKAFLEAMARGLCVVASDEGGMHDLIRHGQNGFLAPPGDSPRVAELASTIMRDPMLCERVGHAARETALRYSWDRVARETAAFYEQLLRMK